MKENVLHALHTVQKHTVSENWKKIKKIFLSNYDISYVDDETITLDCDEYVNGIEIKIYKGDFGFGGLVDGYKPREKKDFGYTFCVTSDVFELGLWVSFMIRALCEIETENMTLSEYARTHHADIYKMYLKAYKRVEKV